MDFALCCTYNKQSWTGEDIFEVIAAGPKIIQPQRIGICEPFKKIEEVNLKATLGEILWFWSNGKKCLGSVSKGFNSNTAHVGLNLYKQEGYLVVDEVFNYLFRTLSSQQAYLLELNDTFYERNHPLSNVLNCAALPTEKLNEKQLFRTCIGF